MQPAVPQPSSYPATFTFVPPEKVANWRAIVNFILAIPQFLLLSALRTLVETAAFIAWFAIVFTGTMPKGLADVECMIVRYQLRVFPFASFMRTEYPPFAFNATPVDDGADPSTRVEFLPTLTDRNRLTVGFRLILVIPHLLVLAALFIAAFVVTVIAFFAVLFTGRWPDGMRRFVLSVARWYVRVDAYLLLLTDEYPPFAFDNVPNAQL
jgi:hypothetical protein